MELPTPWGTRPRFVLVAALAIFAGCGGGEAPAPSPEALRTGAADANLLIVLVDAAAAHHLGSYGYHRDTTPNLDRVAAESIVFDRAYAQASGTMLSVFSFFTSRYPVFETSRRFKPWNQVKTIPPELPTLAQRLAPRYPHRLGYTSNVWMKKKFGHGRGFTEYWESWDPPANLDPALATDEDFVRAGTAWMKDHADDGFFAYLHLMKPHGPYDPPEPYFSRFTDRKVDPHIGTHAYLQGLAGVRPDAQTVTDIVALYDGNLAHVDAILGEMIAELEAVGVWEKTIFVLMADHGQGLYEHGKAHGHGGTICEGTLRVPLFVRIPGVTGLSGRRIATPVELVDLLPTLADLVGHPVAPDSAAGRSLLPLMAGHEASDGELRLIHSRTNRRMPPIFSLMRGAYKLTSTSRGRKATKPLYALFDLEADPGEAHDLLRANPQHPEGAALKKLMKAWLKSGGEQGAGGDAVEFDVFDEDEVERLRSLGYVN